MRYLVFDKKEIQETKYEYEVGNIITVNSTRQYRCMDIIDIKGDTYYMFNVGVVSYKYKEISNEDKNEFINLIKNMESK